MKRDTECPLVQGNPIPHQICPALGRRKISSLLTLMIEAKQNGITFAEMGKYANQTRIKKTAGAGSSQRNGQY